MKKITSFFLLILILGNFGFHLFEYREIYLEKFKPKYWEQRYLRSQWVDPESKESIGDDGLYSYAGWEYIHGKDPTLLNAEMPPLGKYIIGLSILIFKNRNIFALVVGSLVLFALYYFNFFLYRDFFWALLPTVFFSFENLFIGQLRAPFLDTLYLLFLILTFEFFLKEKYFAAALFLGCAASTKGTISTFSLVTLTTFIFLSVFKKREEIISWIFSLPVSFFVLLLSYGRYFLLGHSLREFLGVQKWILNFYATGAKGAFGMVFPMIFFNRWHTWWNGVVKITEWNILWPILTISSLIFPLLLIFKKVATRGKKKERAKELIQEASVIFLGLWIIIYLIFLTVVPVWPRYLLLILPFQYTIVTFFLKKGIEITCGGNLRG